MTIKWNLVSSGLPPKTGFYLITYRWKEDESIRIVKLADYSFGKFYPQICGDYAANVIKNLLENFEIIAWVELPEPFAEQVAEQVAEQTMAA